MGRKLVEVKRGSYVESEHTGHIAVANAEGEVIYRVGDPERLTFARSALKPLQSIPLLQSGAAERFLMSNKELAICCGSHNGEPAHVQTVSLLLGRLGLEEHHLQCGAHAPYHADAHERLLAIGRKPSPLHNNCSGKHAGMLALAIHLQSDIATYHEGGHPVQQRVLGTLCEFAGLNAEDVAASTDGCGIPAFGIPLRKLAQIYAMLANPDSIPSRSLRNAAQRVGAAMMEYPEMVGGTGVLCTDLMQGPKGRMIAKGGAEGVYCIGVVDKGLGIAIKIDDGNARAAYPAALETLSQLGILNDEEFGALVGYRFPDVLNRRSEKVGRIEPVFNILVETAGG